MCSKKKFLIFNFQFLVIVTLFLILPKNIKAVDIVISNVPSTISSNMFTVDVGVSGATNATNYLRVDLYKDGTTNYFGETYNGSDWYSGSDGKNYFPIQIQNSSASAILQAQIGNPNNSEYSGPGQYKLRIRRYTSSGSQSQNDNQTPVDIQITYATPSPTQAPTAQPTAVPTPTTTPTSTVTATAKPTPAKTSTPKSTSSPTSTQSGQADEPIIVQKNDSIVIPTPTPTGLVAGASTSNNKSKTIAITLIFFGVCFLGYCGFLIYNSKNAKIQNTS